MAHFVLLGLGHPSASWRSELDICSVQMLGATVLEVLSLQESSAECIVLSTIKHHVWYSGLSLLAESATHA